MVDRKLKRIYASPVRRCMGANVTVTVVNPGVPPAAAREQFRDTVARVTEWP